MKGQVATSTKKVFELLKSRAEANRERERVSTSLKIAGEIAEGVYSFLYRFSKRSDWREMPNGSYPASRFLSELQVTVADRYEFVTPCGKTTWKNAVQVRNTV